MKKNITVIGVGKLGLCFALTLEKNGYNVLGIDIDSEYIEKINNKTLLSNEPAVNEYLLSSKNFRVSKNIKEGLEFSEILFLFVATPSLPNERYDHSQIKSVVKQILDTKIKNTRKKLVVGCTTMPGFCDTVNDMLAKEGYEVLYNPEFIAQGSIMKNLVNPDILLIGANKINSADQIESIYSNILDNSPSIHKMTLKEAEITKIALNCFLTTKIAYANMVGDIARSANCDPNVILAAIGSDSRIGDKNLKYGFGYGGPCFPRDNRAFAQFANDMKVNAKISKASDIANKQHLEFQIEEFIGKNDIRGTYVFSDLAYKRETTIIEESQKLKFIVELAKKGYSVVIDDNIEIEKQIYSIFGDIFKYKNKN